MSKEKKLSSAEIAKKSAEKLKAYIAHINLMDVPRNQFGSASKLSICQEIGITYSTIGTNSLLSELFDSLDNKLFDVPKKCKKPSSKEFEYLTKRVNQLENQVSFLKGELAQYQSEIAGYQHFVQTGRMVNKKK